MNWHTKLFDNLETQGKQLERALLKAKVDYDTFAFWKVRVGICREFLEKQLGFFCEVSPV